MRSCPLRGRYNLLLTIEGQGLIDENGNYLLNRVYNLGSQLQPGVQQ